jgi:hypothetical protein
MTADEDKSGEYVLAAATAVACEVFGERLDAVFALGSLAHGGFAPLVSDVDIALILTELSSSTPAQVTEVAALAQARAATPLAQRLSVFWADWEGVHHGTLSAARLPAVDRLDLLDAGRLLHGTDRREGAERPDGETLVEEGAEFASSKFDDTYLSCLHHPEALVNDGVRAVTKAVLFPVRFLYTLHTHRIGLNADAADWYAHHGRHRPLAAAAMDWREHDIADPTAARALLHQHLVGLYDEFLDTYIDTLSQRGQHDHAKALNIRRENLHALAPTGRGDRDRI